MFLAICLFIFKESGTFFPEDFFEPIRNFSFSLNDRACPKRELCPAYVIISYLQETIPADTSPLLVCAKPSLYLARSLDFAWVSSFLTGQSISSFPLPKRGSRKNSHRNYMRIRFAHHHAKWKAAGT